MSSSKYLPGFLHLWNCEINLISLDAGHLYGLLLQGFPDLNLVPGEVLAILHKAKHYLGWEISCEEIEQGQLQELLIAEDYMVPSEVSKHNYHYYIWYYLFCQYLTLTQ